MRATKWYKKLKTLLWLSAAEKRSEKSMYPVGTHSAFKMVYWNYLWYD